MRMRESRFPEYVMSGQLAVTSGGGRDGRLAGKRALTGTSSYSNSPGATEPLPFRKDMVEAIVLGGGRGV